MRDCGVLPYVVEPVRRSDAITAWAGLPTVLEMMRSLGLEKAIRESLQVRERESGYSEARKVEALVMLMAAGGDCIDDIEVLRSDAGLCRLVGALPGADALRTFLYEFHAEELIAEAPSGTEEGPGSVHSGREQGAARVGGGQRGVCAPGVAVGDVHEGDAGS